MAFLDTFHFIRPWALLLLLPTLGIVWFLARQQDSTRSLRRMVAPHLLEHLLVRREGTSRWRPVSVLGVLLVLGILALGGPTWKQEPAPFGEDTAALVVVLKVTPSMAAQDIQPSRLERAAQKVGELMERRSGSYTGLIAYAGSAHLVMPLTKDGDLIARFASELSAEVMPV